MSLLEKNFEKILEVLRVTCELFGVKCEVPESYPTQWNDEFQDGKITFQIGDTDYLRFSKYFIGDKLQVEIVTGNYTAKSEWDKRMGPFKDSFQVSTFGFVAHDDNIVDLRTKEGRPMIHDEVLAATVEDEQPLITELLSEFAGEQSTPKCPHCDEVLSAEALEDMECQECEETFWKCERCGELIDEDSDEATECPKCKKTFATMDCPLCNETIFADVDHCEHCDKELRPSQCPHCERSLVWSEDLGTCPYGGCEESLYICPRCNEYIADDPDDSEVAECPKCHGSLVFIDCPECDKDVLCDASSCPRCSAEFELGKCPNGKCSKLIIMNVEITECPHCNDDIVLITCPHCSQKAYVLDTIHQ